MKIIGHTQFASAQRLAASPEKSLCQHERVKPCRHVLNASRHHRKNRFAKFYRNNQRSSCSTPRGITGKIACWIAAGDGAEEVVLNASRHHRKNRASHRSTSRAAFGAQRLAASPEKSPANIDGLFQPLPVLNASRHHRKNRRRFRHQYCRSTRCSTPRGITGKIASRGQLSRRRSSVLNASRHHRKNRIVGSAAVYRANECSTPRGITGKIAVGAVGEGGREMKEVLNASRHHRKNRFTGAVIGLSSRLCSTPRGITGKIASGPP